MIDCRRAYGYDCLVADTAMLKARFPGRLRTGIAGYSVQGRRLITLSIGEGPQSILLLGTHHGREYVTGAFLMRMAESILEQGIERPRFVFLPMVNPDGAEICIRGTEEREILQMPRREGSLRCWKANARGVDLNRNYPCLFAQKAVTEPAPASQNYNGPSAASEPEVRAAMRLALRERPRLALTLHTKGEEILYSDSNSPRLEKEALRWAEAIAQLSGYCVLPPSADPAVYAAGFENWFRERLKRPCLLLELGVYDGPQPFDPVLFEREIWEKLKGLPKLLQKMLSDT